MIRRWWHRRFGHPQLKLEGAHLCEDLPPQYKGEWDGVATMYSCQCGGWVDIEELEELGQFEHRHIRIVERGKLA